MPDNTLNLQFSGLGRYSDLSPHVSYIFDPLIGSSGVYRPTSPSDYNQTGFTPNPDNTSIRTTSGTLWSNNDRIYARVRNLGTGAIHIIYRTGLHDVLAGSNTVDDGNGAALTENYYKGDIIVTGNNLRYLLWELSVLFGLL